jgi:hypothetical protein
LQLLCRLDFGTAFWFDQRVSVSDGLSYGVICRSLESGSPIAFVTTHWSVAQQAQENHQKQQRRWSSFAAITGDRFAHSRRRKVLVQKVPKAAFRISCRIAWRKSLNDLRKEKGRLRSCPMSLKHFLSAKAAPIPGTVAK